MSAPPPGVPVLPRTTRDLARVGVTAGHLRGPRWRQASRGLHVPAGVSDLAPPLRARQRVLEAATWMPGRAALTGWSVALACGVPGVDGCDPRTWAERSVGVVTGGTHGHRAPRGVATVRRALGEVHAVRVRAWDPITEAVTRVDLRVVPPVVAVCDELVVIERLDCAVAFCDQVLHAGWVTRPELRDEVDRRAGSRGVLRLREVLDLADAAAASPWESILRVFCSQAWGWTHLQVNVPVRDGRGHLVGIVDLLDEQAGVVIEFDGAYHRDRHQHRRDNLREEALEALGLIVVRVDSLDLLHRPGALAARLPEARVRGLGRDRTYDRWAA